MAAHKLRTISFADKRVKDLLKNHFVLVWVDYDGRGQIDLRDSFTKEEVDASPLGFGGRNVKMFVAVPGGSTVSQLGGYWSPEFLIPFLEFSRTSDSEQAKAGHAALAARFQKLQDAERDPVRLAALKQLNAWHTASSQSAGKQVRELLRAAAAAMLFRGC